MPTGTKHTKETFLAALFAKYPENEKLYCYKDSVFVNIRTKWTIVCKTCKNIFEQRPRTHWQGNGCPKCANTTKSHEKWISEFNQIHKNKYSYPEKIVHSDKKIRIICPDHGVFFQTPKAHHYGKRCRKCGLKEMAKKLNNNAKIISDPETGFYINTKIWNAYQKSAKDRKLSFEIKLEDILEIYKKQNGLCAFTHAKLICDSTYSRNNNWSIDRLDSNKGYTKDNIVLVTKTINMFRNKSSASEFLEICNMVASVYNLTQKYCAMTPQEKAEKLKTHSICYAKKKNKEETVSVETKQADAIV